MVPFDKAIILAAGAGRRMGSEGDSPRIAKPLLPLDASGVTFLDWHIAALARVGVREVFLVGSPEILGTATAQAPGVRITWIDAEANGRDTGSAFSLHAALGDRHGVLDDRSRVVMMDADLVYDPDLFVDLARASNEASKTLVCTQHTSTGEEVLVFAQSGETHPCLHGKGLEDTEVTRDLVCVGEATGIVVVEPRDHRLFRAATQWTLTRSKAGIAAEHEDVTQVLLARQSIVAVTFDDAARFSECDTPDDYAYVRNTMAPRWISKLGRP